MYIRYNNPTPQSQNPSHLPPQHKETSSKHYEKCKEQKEEKGTIKNPLKFLPKEIYNPHTHKFFGKLSGDDILIIALILMVLDSGCDEDILLVLALLYVLFSDWLDFGNIFS